MKKYRLAILYSALLMGYFVSLAYAEEDTCKGTSALEQGQCAEQRFKTADKQLNKLYKKIVALLSSGGSEDYSKTMLINAQKAWINFRDSNCEFYGEVSGGAQTWKSTYTVSCWADMTENRIKQLEDYFQKYDLND